MRRLFHLLPLVLLAGTSLCFGSPLKSKGVYDFSKGCDTYHSSLSLPDGYVAGCQDVLFDDKAPVTKRFGYTTAFSSGSNAYQAEWNYTDPTNTSWIIVRSSTSILASNLSGSVVLVATVSANNLVGETNSQGNAFFVDQTNGVYYWNGSSTTYIAGSPFGSLITSFHGRIWVSGAAVPNGNQLYGSAYLNGTLWTPNINPNDPVQLTVGLQDNFDNITAMYPFLDTLYTFKHFSTYALYGYDQTSFQIGFITAECGCIDQGSIQTFNHGLDFVSERGVEFFDGYTCTRNSDAMKSKVDQAIQSQGGSNINSWVQSTQTDWNAGTAYASFTDTTTIPGVVTLPNEQLTASNFISNTTQAWGTASLSVSSPTVILSTSGAATFQYSENWASLPGQFDHRDSYIQFTGRLPNLFGFVKLQVGVTDSTTTIQGHGFGISLWNEGPPLTASGGTIETPQSSSAGADYVVTNPNDTLLHTVLMHVRAAGTGEIFVDGVDQGSQPLTWPSSGPQYLVITCGSATSQSDPCEISNASISLSTGSFTTQVHNAGSVNSWGNFSAQETLGGGSISFNICSSANSSMSPETCLPQAINSQILIATNSYVQWSASFTAATSTDTSILNSGTVQWFSGNRTPGMTSTVWDNRYWLSFSSQTSDAFNDSTLVLNTKGAWSLFNIPAGGLSQYKNSLYIADARPTGNVYLYGHGYNDNGVPINAFIVSKDYPQDGLSSDDYYDSLYVSEDDLGNYNTGIQFVMDRDIANSFTLSSVNQSEFSNNASIKIPFIFQNQNFGKTISLIFTESDLNSPWNFYGWEMFYHPRNPQ